MKKTNKLIVVLSIIFCILAIGVMSYATSAGDVLSGLTGEGANVNVAVVILLVLGIKYMMGSAEEKAEYKKSMIPYIVGAVLIFASTTIVGVVYDMANALEQSSSGNK